MTFVFGLVGFLGAIGVIVGCVVFVLSLDSIGDAIDHGSGESASGL